MRVFTRHGLFGSATIPKEYGVECWKALNQTCSRNHKPGKVLVEPLVRM